MDTGLQQGRVSNDCTKNEKLMDEYLRSQGLYRKEIAKDGSCLFRAVAEQILHCQSRHLEVRYSCASYLRRNRSKYEAFIEGTFEEYLKRLENPQEPGKPAVNITDNNFPDKVSLCFLNGNHYDIVYPKQFTEAAALCQSIVYELLYKVLGVDSSKQTSSLQSYSESDQDAREECESSDESDLDAGDAYWTEGAAESADMNKFRSRYDNQVPKPKDEEEDDGERCELSQAVSNDEDKLLAELLSQERYRRFINSRSGWGIPGTPLRLAASRGHLRCLEVLLAHDAEVDSLDVKAQTPLFTAVSGKHLDCVHALLQAGANPNGSIYNNCSPVLTAAREGDEDILRELLQFGAELLIDVGANVYLPTLIIEKTTKQNEAVELLLKERACPKTLMSRCRLAIRRYMRKANKMHYIDQLDIPPILRNYLNHMI
ncbi:UNVERIFIED_CONTAM: hypothetical protein FKN15_071711 [Acipenser sinensis]